MIYVKLPIQRRITWQFEQIRGLGYIGGGYARWAASTVFDPVKPEDIDIFCTHVGAEKQLKVLLESSGFIATFENDLVINLSGGEIPVQIIKPLKGDKVQTYGTPEEILNYFDFTVSKAVIVNDKEVLVHKDFQADEEAKRLKMLHITDPITAFFRAAKYMAKGYSFDQAEALKLFKDWEARSVQYKQKVSDTINEPKAEGSNYKPMGRLTILDLISLSTNLGYTIPVIS